MDSHPKLRAVDIRPFLREGQPFLLLRDPLALSKRTVVVPQGLGPLLALCDGTRDVDTLSAALAIRFGVRMRADQIRHVVALLDEALLLENDRLAEARAAILEAYRGAPFRSPVAAGQSYPADAEALRAVLQGYLDESTEDAPLPGWDPADCRGLITPHIDYVRGGPVYAQVWKHAAERVRAADLAVILGTEHHGSGNDITLTRQHYATPFGVLPTDGAAVDALAAAVGAEEAFAGELQHRGEHSIELAAVWLHFMRGEQPCAVLPILCGPLSRFIQGTADPGTDESLKRLLDALVAVTDGHRAVVVAAADMAHVGPAFGGKPLDLAARVRLQAADDELIQRVCMGDAPGFLDAIRRTANRNNVCGVAPIYLALRLLSPAQGHRVSYALCPADERGDSAVSVCGILLR